MACRSWSQRAGPAAEAVWIPDVRSAGDYAAIRAGRNPMGLQEAIVYIVADDVRVREALRELAFVDDLE
jgi:hypothetical protein